MTLHHGVGLFVGRWIEGGGSGKEAIVIFAAAAVV